MKLKRIKIDKKKPILSAQIGASDTIFEDIVALYFQPGWTIADVTWGKGVFWKGVNTDDFRVFKSDVFGMPGIDVQADFEDLPYKRHSFDAIVYDPPYLHVGGLKTLKYSVDKGYRNAHRGFAGKDKVVNMYKRFIDRAPLYLRKSGGLVVLKYMMQVESTWVRASTVEVFNYATEKGYKLVDWLINVNPTVPLMRHDFQMHSRRNYSDWLVLWRKGNG